MQIHPFLIGFDYIIYMKTPYLDPFWERVKKLIRAHKITQEKFAAYIGVSFNTFKSWLRFNRIPNAYVCHDIAVALGVSVEFLVEGVDGKAMEKREQEALARKTAAGDIKKMARLIRRSAAMIG